MIKKRILVVEDDASISQLLRLALTKNGFDVFIAHDEKEWTKHLKDQTPDLLLVDIMLQNQNGILLYEDLLSKGGISSEVPAFFLSASISDTTFVSSPTGKKYRAFAKPFEVRALVDSLKTALSV